MKKLNSILLITMISISYAFARSGGAGNGGDAIVCPDRVMLLDSYEAQKMRLTIDLSNPNIKNPTWRSMVNVAVKRVEKFDEHTSSKLYDYAMEMVNDFEKFQMYPDSRGSHVYIGNDIIAEINDSEHVSTPEGCEDHPRQLVSQRVPKFKYEYRYEFSKSLWDRMTLQEQAMTILHEAWYRIMLENGAENSRAARYINGLVASKEFEKFTFEDYLQEIRETELKFYIITNQSEAVKKETIKINLDEHIINMVNGEACAPRILMNLSIKESFRLLNRNQKYIKNLAVQNLCFKNSRITKIELPTKIIDSKYTLRLPFSQLVFKMSDTESPTLHFHTNGRLSHFSGITFSKLTQMFYRCSGVENYERNDGCEEGPFNNRETAISDPINIIYNQNERIISHFQ